MGMTRLRRIALIWILLCGGISIFWGLSIGCAMPAGVFDFKGPYYFARCLLQHRDPYKVGEPLLVYQADGGDHLQLPYPLQPVLSLNMYLPTAYIVTVPFALLPWGLAHLLWRIFAAGSLIVAAFLMLKSVRTDALGISLVLICFVLANCEIIFATGAISGIVVGLCIIAAWCFLEERFVLIGILCMAVGLAIKPHDCGLVWLFFLLAGGAYRKRALQTLALTIALGLPAVLWVSQVSPHWVQELHSNVSTASALNGNCDPGPTNPFFGSGPEMVIDLQSTISAFRNDPRFFNPISYLVCGALLLVWSVRTLRLRFSLRSAWLALAAVVPLTMLVSYHRPYDAKLLLLTVPACAMLWAEGGLIRWLALLFNAGAIVFTADIPLIILNIFTKNLMLSKTGLAWSLLHGVLLRPTPLILLAMGVFYLGMYMWPDTGQILKAAS